MGLTKLAQKRPVSAILVILAIVVFGFTSLFGMRMEQMPDMEMPILLVMTTYAGADPETVDELVSSEIEGSIGALSGVDTVTSYSYENYSMVMIQYDYGTDIDSSYLDLRAALDTAKSSMPEDVRDPVVIKMDVNAMATLTVSATSESGADVLTFLDEGMMNDLKSLSSVAQVDVSGGQENYVSVLLNQDMLSEYGLTMSTIANYISATDFTIPIGSLDQGSQSISAISTAANKTIQELQRIPLYTATGSLVQLSDVADVSWSVKDASSISRFDGKENVTLSITKNQNASTLGASSDVKKMVEKYQKQTDDISFEVIYDAADDVKSSLSSVASTLVLGVIFSMLVLFIFFGDFRASMIVGSSIPLSLLMTLILMKFMGFSLNVVTLGALVIAIGMMVDSSIVVLESCFRTRETKPDFQEAAVEGTRLVLNSIVASTLTTIVVYLPLAMMKGLSGQMFSQLGYTIVFAMVSSLLSAMAFVPLFFKIFKPVERKEVKINYLLVKVTKWYDKNVRKIMYRKKTAVIVAIVLLISSFAILSQVNMELIPNMDSGTLSVSAEFRPGTRLEEMDEQIVALEELVAGYEDVKNYNLTASGSTASISVNLIKDRKMSTDEIKEDLIQKTRDFAGMEIDVTSSSITSSMSSGDGAEVNLSGIDLEELKNTANAIADRSRDIPGALSVSSTAESASTRLEVVVDPLLAMNYGLTPAQVAGTLYGMVSGSEAMKITSEGDEYSVFLEFPKGAYDTPNNLMGAMISSNTGASVPISEIATLEYTDGQETIQKQGGKYVVTVSAQTLASDKEAVQTAMDQIVDEVGLPASVSLTENMMTEMMNEEFTALFQAILTALFLIFLVMAMQFESPKYSLMVMLSIPFSFIGSFFLLFVTGATISMVSLMGILMLVGIVVNNGILYVDTTNMLRETMSIEDALVQSGKIRLRPILMTTLTTILSMVPMALGIGSGAAMMQGMAVIIIGGLITSTILILILIPSFYLMLYANKEKPKKRGGLFRRKKNKELPEVSEPLELSEADETLQISEKTESESEE